MQSAPQINCLGVWIKGTKGTQRLISDFKMETDCVRTKQNKKHAHHYNRISYECRNRNRV